MLSRRTGVVLLIAAIFALIALLTRVALVFHSFHVVGWDLSLVGAFALGLAFDLATIAWFTIPIVLLLAILPRGAFTGRIASAFWHIAIGATTALFLFGAVAEWFFWDEFGVRFNFIAVDYLVYTTEVLGNIRESYPLPLILGTIALTSAALIYLLSRAGLIRAWLDHPAQPALARWRQVSVASLACLIPALGLSLDRIPEFANNYNHEIAQNGVWSFFAAFRNNELDYTRFYPTMPSRAAFQRIGDILAENGSSPLGDATIDTLRQVPGRGTEIHPNIIQITVESLSARFLTRYGSTENITPHLDELCARSLVFDNFYATGNRTDRGMESLSLSIPPTPGRSLVKRPHNEDLFTLGSVLRTRGYSNAFIYGGYGYFDNMNYFFGSNGYRIVDRASVPKSDISFANAWGACDEDLFRWTLREADRDFASGRPFFHFVMTTSNHRPYTFPSERIDLPSKASGRRGAVKYTDFAIDDFLKQAAHHPWYSNTIFVIVADHCASSAGKTTLPIENYHIPLLIFAPGGQIAPGVVKALCSQIDYAPTLLGLMNWTYDSRFFGCDVLAPGPKPHGRSLIATYQKLGLYRDGVLAVLSPLQKLETFSYREADSTLTVEPSDEVIENDAIAYYQTASELFRAGRYRALPMAQ